MSQDPNIPSIPSSAGSVSGEDKFTPYKPRSFEFLGIWERDDWAFKVYGINHQTEHSPCRLINPLMADAARDRVHDQVAVLNSRDHHHQTGFVVIHQALGGNWLLLRWWEHEVICCQMLWESSEQQPDHFATAPEFYIACVFEMVVIDFERRTWIEKMLRGDGDRASYLATRLADGYY